VDAVLSVTRSSGLFTQDVEDFDTGGKPDPTPITDLVPPDVATHMKSKQPPNIDSQYSRPLARTMTDAQRTILLRKAQAAGLSQQAIVDFIGRSFGAASLDDLPFEHINHVLKWIEESRQPGADG